MRPFINKVKGMSEQRELTIRIVIDGEQRQVVLPFEATDGVANVVKAFGFKNRTEWCQALLDGHFFLTPGKKRFMKQFILTEIQIINSLIESLDKDIVQVRHKTVERYLLSGFRPGDVAKMTNSAKTRVYDMANKIKKGATPTTEPAPTVTEDKAELDESMAVLNLAKQMHKAVAGGVGWESLVAVKRIMWIDAAVTELSTKYMRFADILPIILDKPETTLASRKSWANRSKFILLNEGELQITCPEVASVWKPTGEDILATDWFLM